MRHTPDMGFVGGVTCAIFGKLLDGPSPREA